jgi:hypothetical protein
VNRIYPNAPCYFARAKKCRRFKGEAAFGNDRLIKQTFYGFRFHANLSWPGVITSFILALAKVDSVRAFSEMIVRATLR